MIELRGRFSFPAKPLDRHDRGGRESLTCCICNETETDNRYDRGGHTLMEQNIDKKKECFDYTHALKATCSKY